MEICSIYFRCFALGIFNPIISSKGDFHILVKSNKPPYHIVMFTYVALISVGFLL